MQEEEEEEEQKEAWPRDRLVAVLQNSDATDDETQRALKALQPDHDIPYATVAAAVKRFLLTLAFTLLSCHLNHTHPLRFWSRKAFALE